MFSVGEERKKCNRSQKSTAEYIAGVIREHQEQGMNDADIASLYSVTRQYVANIRKEYGIPANQKSGKGEEFDRLYREGYPDTVIAKKTGVSYQAVQKWRKKNGLEPNRKKGGRSVGKIREDRPLYKEANRILNNPGISSIIQDAIFEFLSEEGMTRQAEITAWASQVIPPADIFHPAPGGFCVPPENTNLTHAGYVAYLESRQDRAGLCGVPSVELLEKAIEMIDVDNAGKKIAHLIAGSGYIEEHRTVDDARRRSPDRSNKWEKIWDEYREKSTSWAPVQRESREKIKGLGDKPRFSGKKGKGGGTKNIGAAKAFQGAAGY